MRSIVCALALILTAGCASTQWAHPYKSPADYYSDAANCQGFANAASPQPIPTGYNYNVNVNRAGNYAYGSVRRKKANFS